MFIVYENGDMAIRQGDQGKFAVTGLKTDKNYTLYFAIQNEDRQAIGSEIAVSTNKSANVTIVLTTNLTDLLTVPSDEESKDYYYGIKLCDGDGYEDTSIIGSSGINGRNKITVYPKKVEGTT